MSRALRSRLFATQAMLLETQGDAARDISQLQKNAVEDLLERERDGMSADVKSELAEKLVQIKWHSGHLASLLATLSARPIEPVQAGRRTSQNWMRIIHMYPESAWKILLDKKHRWITRWMS